MRAQPKGRSHGPEPRPIPALLRPTHLARQTNKQTGVGIYQNGEKGPLLIIYILIENYVDVVDVAEARKEKEKALRR